MVAVSTDISNWPAFIAFFLIIITVTQIAQLPITTVAKRSLIEIPFIFFALLMPFFGTIPFASIRIYEGSPLRVDNVFATYNIAKGDAFTGHVSMVMGIFYKKNNEW